MRAQMFTRASGVLGDKVTEALDRHINDIKPQIKVALEEVTTMRKDLVERVDTYIPQVMDEVHQMKVTMTTQLTGITDQVTDILTGVKDIMVSTKHTTTIVSQIMEVVCAVSSIVTFVGKHTVLHGLTALWSIWKVIKICLDIFPAIKGMSLWAETAAADIEMIEAEEVSAFRAQAGNTLLTGLGFAAVVTKFMPPWVVKTLDTFSRNSRYRILEDLSWLGDAVGIVLEIPSFIIGWVADNFEEILAQSIKVANIAEHHYDVPYWHRFNEYMLGLNIPTKLRECAEVYQSIICRLPGDRKSVV